MSAALRDPDAPESLWSVAELSAMRLDGELVDLGESAVHVDRLVGPTQRAASLARLVRPGSIVCGAAAAWIHEAAPRQRELDVASRRDRRIDPVDDARVRGHVLSISLLDTVVLGGVRVTTVARTAYDLLWLPSSLPQPVLDAAVRTLTLDHPEATGVAALRRSIETGVMVPRRALHARLDRALERDGREPVTPR